MGDTVIPLRAPGEARTSLSRIDAAAVELLSAGDVATLQAARIAVILTDLRVQRDRFAAVLADLRRQRPEARLEADAARAALILTVAQGIVRIDAFLDRARVTIAPTDGRAPTVTPAQTR